MHSTPSARDPWPTPVILALATGGFAIGTTEFATMSLVPYFAASLHIDAPTAAHVISAYALGVVVGAPVIAVLSARMARRRLLMLLMGVFVFGNGLSAVAPNYRWILAFRFLSGLPHGAFFGTASVVAASLVPGNRRTQAVGQVFLGLTVATIVGVPLANWLGQSVGWRWSFVVVAGLGMAALVMVAMHAPRDVPGADASPLRELGALKRTQVWLTLSIGAIGFGGLFAMYTYLASTLSAVTHVGPGYLPLLLCVFGIGMTVTNIVVPRFADRAPMRTAGALLLWAAFTLALYPFAARNIWFLTFDVFCIATSAALASVLQTRLMDVSGDAQALPAALNHSAFNTANALGPWLGGMAIAAGYGWTSTGWVGCGLALAGLGIWAVSFGLERRAPFRPRYAGNHCAEDMR